MPDPTRAHGNSYECLLSAISRHSRYTDNSESTVSAQRVKRLR